MVQFVDASVRTEVLVDFFNEKDTYKSSNDPFAFAISGWQDDSPLDPDYGHISLMYEFWNATDDILINIPSRQCTYQDFGYDLESDS